MKIYIISLLFLFLIVNGCSDKKKETSKEEEDVLKARIEKKEEKTEVRVSVAKRDRFEMELVSNGKANARRKAVLDFEVKDVVAKVNVKNGDQVQTGDIIASVDSYKSEQLLKDAQLALKKSEQDLLSRLISEGIKTIEDTNQISQQRLHTIMLQSGYTLAQNSYTKALHDFQNITIKAPFPGVIADLEAREHNPAASYKNLCTLIDNSEMEIIFNVLETEINHMRSGMEIEITPYANPEAILIGGITEINPKIDENGMVKIKAVTINKNKALVDGMNVSILIKRQIEEKLFIPKSAVLPRQGKKVVFVHENGKAIWKYVTTGQENSRNVCIESGLNEGEEVIYDNNLGLSHESDVTVIPNQK